MTGGTASEQFGNGGKPRILFLSHTHIFGPFRVGSHHYARSFARSGADVVHLSTPISLAHRLTGRVSGESMTAVPRGPTRDVEGVTHVVPRTLVPRPFGQFHVAAELKRNQINPAFDAVLIDQPLLWDSSVRGMSRRLVYRPTDLYPSGVKAQAQRRIVDAADGVVATSGGVLEGLGTFAAPSIVLENGVDSERFAPEISEERPPVCVYVGALDARFDWRQLDAWALQHPTVRFLVAGPLPASPPKMPDNVELVGAVPHHALPGLLHRSRVGLLNLSDDPLNAARSPMKLNEYLAAGLTVVARETPVLQPDPNAGLLTYTGSSDAAIALERALASSSANIAGMRRAATESWDAKANQLLGFIRSCASTTPS